MNQNSRRHFSFLLVALAITSLTFAQVGCDPDQLASSGNTEQQAQQPNAGQYPNSAPQQYNGQPTNTNQPNNTFQPYYPKANANAGLPANNVSNSQIIIGSFNIQMFGKTKMSRPAVVAALADITRRFDILAIQELRDKDQAVIPEFLSIINQNGAAYAAAVGPRQGYVVEGKTTTYFEQSVFIYDTRSIELVGKSYAAIDRANVMHRPPFVGQFRCKMTPPNLQPFTFNLMNVHIDPDDAHQEFVALLPILAEIYQQHPNEDDFILLGDFNEEPHKYSRYPWMRQQHAALPSQWKTNTAMTEAYDNIVFDPQLTAEFTGQSGVMNLMEEYKVGRDDAKHISDHMPVWAVFTSYEAVPGRSAAASSTVR